MIAALNCAAACFMCAHWCRGGRRDRAHLCTGDGLHRAVLAPVGKATPGSLLPRLHPPGSQEWVEAGSSHRHLPPCALHACNQPLHAHRSDPQSPPAILCNYWRITTMAPQGPVDCNGHVSAVALHGTKSLFVLTLL